MSLSSDQEHWQAVSDSIAGVPIKKRKYVADVPLKKRHYFLADLPTTSTQLSSSPKEPGLPNDQQIIPESELSLSGLTELSLNSSQILSSVPHELGLSTEEQSVSESKLPLSGIVHDINPQTTGLADEEHASSGQPVIVLGLPTEGQSVSESKLPLSGIVHDINPQTTGLADEEHASSGQPVIVLGLPTEEQSVSESKLPLSGIVHDINPQTTGLADEEHASSGQPVIVKCEKSCRVEDAIQDNVEVVRQVEISAKKMCAGEIVKYELRSDPREKVSSTSVPFTTELVSTSKESSMMQLECSNSGKIPVTGFMCKADKVEENTNIQMSLGESLGLHNEKLLQDASNCSLNLGQYQRKLDFPISSIRDRSVPGKGVECDSRVDNGSGLANRSHWDLNTTMDTWDGSVGDSKKFQIENICLQRKGKSVENCSLGLVKEEDGGAAGQGISIALPKDIGQNGSTLNLSSSPSLASKELENNRTLNYLCSSKISENFIPEMSLHLQLNPPCTFDLHSKAISSQQEATSHSLSGSRVCSSLTMSVEAISQTKNLNLPPSRTIKPEPVEDKASGGTLKMVESCRQSIPSQGAVKSEPSYVGNSDVMQPVVFQSIKPEPDNEISRKLEKCVESSPAVCEKLNIKLNIQDNISTHTSSMNGGHASSHAALFNVVPESIHSATDEPLVRSTHTSSVDCVTANVGESIAVSEQCRYPYSGVDVTENKEEVKLNKFQEEPFWGDGGYEKFNISLVYTGSTTKSHDADDDFEDGEFRETRHIDDESLTPGFVGNNYQDLAEGQCSTSLDSKNAASSKQHRKTLSEDKDLTKSANFVEQKDKIGVLNKVSVINPVKNVISVKKSGTNVVNAIDTKKVSTLVTRSPSSRRISEGDVHKSESTKKKPVRTMQKTQRSTSNKEEFASTGMTSDQTADAAKKLAQEGSAPLVSGIQTSSVETDNAKLGKIGEPFKEEHSVNCEGVNKGTNCNVNRSRIINLPRNNSSSYAGTKPSSGLHFSSRIDGDRHLDKTDELQSRGNREEGRKKVFHKIQRVRNQDQPSGVSNSDSASARRRFDGCINSSHEKWTLNHDYVSERYSSASATHFSVPRSAVFSVSSVLEADNYTRRDRSSFNGGVRLERKPSNDELLDFSCLPPRRHSPVERDVEPGLLGMRMCQVSMREVSPDRFVGRSQRDYDRDEPFVRRDRSFSPLQKRGTCRMSGMRTRSPRPRNCSPGPRSSPRKRSPDRMGRHHVMKEERMRTPQGLFEDMVGSRLRGSPLRQHLPTDMRSISSPRHHEAGRSFVPNRSPTDRVLHRSNSRYDKIDHRGREDEYLESMHSSRFHEFAESECLDDEGRGTSGRFRHAHSFRSFNDDLDYEDFRYGMDGARSCRPSPESDIDYHDCVSARGFEGRIRKGMGYHPRRLRSVEGEDNVRCNQRWLESSFSEERQKRRRF